MIRPSGFRWPWRRPRPTPAWARSVVASIPEAELPNHLVSFAEAWAETRDPERREQHRQKCMAAAARLEEILNAYRAR